MGIQDVRNAFLSAGNNLLRCSDCELTTVQDGGNSQQLVIRGTHADGTPFDLDSGPFDASIRPAVKAAEMARGWLDGHAGFRQPPAAAAR